MNADAGRSARRATWNGSRSIAPDGTAHYSSGEVKNVAERDYFKRAMKGERCLSDPLESVVDGETRVILVCRYIMLVKWQACLAALMMWAP